MTYVAHELLDKTISRRDDLARTFERWPWSDHDEATIKAVWLSVVPGGPYLFFAAAAADGSIGQVCANNVRLGPFVEVPSWDITCPHCDQFIARTTRKKAQTVICHRDGCGKSFEWVPPPA